MNIINDMLVDKCFLDNANARAVVPAYKEKTDSGNPITLTDSVENKPLGMKLYGWSKQVVTTGKNLCSIKSCQLSANIVSSDIVLWTKKNRIYFSCDTENVENSNAYISVDYYDKNRERLGGNGALIPCHGTRKETSFSGNEAGTNSTNVDLTTVEYITFRVGLTSSSVPTSFIDNIMACDEANQPYEPYTGGKPSPSPEYPQEIVSAGQKLITGKNLINADDYYSAYKQTDGMYKVDDVELNDIRIIFDSSMVGKTYTASCNLNCPNTVSSVALEANIDGEKVLGNIIPTNKNGISKVTFTPKTVRDSIKITYGTGRGDIIFSDFQIEAGSFATSYEPYTGGVPTLYQKDIEVRVTGKNLLNFEDFLKTRNAIYTKESESYQITSIGQAYSNPYKFSDEDIDVAISCILDNITSKDARIDALDSSKKFVASTYYKDFAKCKASHIRLNYTENGIFNIQKVQIERGVTATAYELYHEPQFFSISTPTGLPAIPVDTDGNYTDVNGQQWIADYIDLKRGKYVQRVWQKTFDGSESWGLYGDTGFMLDNILPEKMSNREMLCNQFRRRGGGTNSNIIIVGAFSTNSSIYIENCTLIDNTLVDNMLSKWKMHLAKYPLVVTTYLNEQIERDLTPEELEEYTQFYLYKPTTIIENDSDCWMDVTYKAGTSGKSKNEALRWYFKNVMPLVE